MKYPMTLTKIVTTLYSVEVEADSFNTAVAKAVGLDTDQLDEFDREVVFQARTRRWEEE